MLVTLEKQLETKEDRKFCLNSFLLLRDSSELGRRSSRMRGLKKICWRITFSVWTGTKKQKMAQPVGFSEINNHIWI